MEEKPETLGDANEWQAEWKWDGIRGEIIKRNNELFVWSRGEELMTDKFPEYVMLKKLLPEGVVLDGEIISAVEWKTFALFGFANTYWQKEYGKKQLKESPIGFFAYDLLEFNGEDWREKLLERKKKKT